MDAEKNVYEEVNKEKDICERDILGLIDRAKSYHVNNIDISKYYDLSTDYEKYKVDDTLQRYRLNKEITDYKIDVLQTFLNELFEEKKFVEFKLGKEQALSDQEYKEYLSNVVARTEYVNRWYSEFINQ
jgi:lysine/ornithine N-monooxygenase